MAGVTSYRGSGDGLVYGITALVSVILVFIALRTFWRAMAATSVGPQLGMAAVGVFCLALLLGAWLFAPSGYGVSPTAVIVNRPVGNVEIPLSTIQSVEAFDGSLRAGAMRTFGTGGLFGVYGRYHHPSIGHYRMYGTRTDGAVVIQGADGIVVLTPDDLTGFVEDVSSRLQGS